MFKNLNPFRIKPLSEVVQHELLLAERALLEALSSRDNMNAMVTYHGQRVDRLRKVLDSAPRAA